MKDLQEMEEVADKAVVVAAETEMVEDAVALEDP